MKKIIALLLVLVMCSSLSACQTLIEWVGVPNSYVLAEAAEPLSVEYQDYYNNDGYRAFLAKIQDFSARLTDKVCAEYGKSENIVISPLSIYMALSLACECASGETRQEILDAVGVSYEEVNKYTKMLYGFANVEYKQSNAMGLKATVALQQLNNSIWLDKDIEFKQDGVNKLASEYNTDVYQTSFKTNEAKRLIKQYIESKSHGLLDGDVDLSPETYFVLMNTYYLKEIWNDYGDELPFTKDKYYFQNSDGSTTHTKLLQGYYAAGREYNGENHSVFYTGTDHGLKLYFFLPYDEWSVESIFTAENISTVLALKDWGYEDHENKQRHYTRALFPEFTADFSGDIESILSEDFGIEALFDFERCDMSNVTNEPVYCNGVIHKATLDVNKDGIEGAAVTYIPMAGAAGPDEYEEIYHEFYITGAFGFVLTDSYGTVVFSGIINNIE